MLLHLLHNFWYKISSCSDQVLHDQDLCNFFRETSLPALQVCEPYFGHVSKSLIKCHEISDGTVTSSFHVRQELDDPALRALKNAQALSIASRANECNSRQ